MSAVHLQYSQYADHDDLSISYQPGGKVTGLTSILTFTSQFVDHSQIYTERELSVIDWD